VAVRRDRTLALRRAAPADAEDGRMAEVGVEVGLVGQAPHELLRRRKVVDRGDVAARQAGEVKVTVLRDVVVDDAGRLVMVDHVADALEQIEGAVDGRAVYGRIARGDRAV